MLENSTFVEAWYSDRSGARILPSTIHDFNVPPKRARLCIHLHLPKAIDAAVSWCCITQILCGLTTVQYNIIVTETLVAISFEVTLECRSAVTFGLFCQPANLNFQEMSPIRIQLPGAHLLHRVCIPLIYPRHRYRNTLHVLSSKESKCVCVLCKHEKYFDCLSSLLYCVTGSSVKHDTQISSLPPCDLVS